MLFLRYFVGISLFLLLHSCNETAADNNLKNLLVGKWETQKAFRNNVETSLLNEAYFEFKPDDVILTNIPGIPQEATYILKDKKIELQQENAIVQYEIEQIDDDMMILKMKWNKFDFQFHLKKQKATKSLDVRN